MIPRTPRIASSLISPENPVKLTNLKITPKLGILVGVTLLGLCVAGVLAGYLMQREMLSAKTEQLHAIVDIARNMAAGLQKQVDAGQLTKEAAIAEFGRRGNSMTFETATAICSARPWMVSRCCRPMPSRSARTALKLSPTEDRSGASGEMASAAKGEHTMIYEYVRPGATWRSARSLIRRRSRAGTCMSAPAPISMTSTPSWPPIAWMLGLAILGIAVIGGSIAWMIGRSISKPLGLLGDRMQALADGKLDGEIPGIGRGDEVGAMAATVQIFKDNAVRIRGLEKAEEETKNARPRPSVAGPWKPRRRFRTQRQRHRPFGVIGGGGHADHRAVDDLDRQRRQRPCRHRRRGFAKRFEQCPVPSRPRPKSCRVRWPRFPARWRVPARLPARRWAMPKAPMPRCGRCRRAPKKSARW